MIQKDNWEISEILDDIILGRGVKRSVHNLEYDQFLYTSLFIDRLRIYKYRPCRVSDISIEIGWRAPAFLISNKIAIFGYVFWELFTETKKRKLFGSVIKNAKGDWKYTLSDKNNDIVFVNLDHQEEIDIYHLL